MTHHPQESPNITTPDTPPVAVPARSPAGAGPKTLASRIAGFATNVLATGLILILGAVGGQHALRWWSAARSLSAARTVSNADPLLQTLGPEAVERTGSPTGSDGEPQRHVLTFGDYPLLATRTELRGGTQEVLARLRDDCRIMAERTKRVERIPGPAEQRMLERIRGQEPIESTAHWRMYQIESPLPLVVTVFDQPALPRSDSTANVVAMESRVVSWGLAFPVALDGKSSQDRWTLFTLTGENPQVGSSSQFRTLPIPPHSQRTMSLQAESGATMIGFSGIGSVREWQTFYDAEFAEPGWSPASGWRHDGPSWQRSFTSPREGRLDVQLIEATDGSLNGLLMAAPPLGGETENDR